MGSQHVSGRELWWSSRRQRRGSSDELPLSAQTVAAPILLDGSSGLNQVCVSQLAPEQDRNVHSAQAGCGKPARHLHSPQSAPSAVPWEQASGHTVLGSGVQASHSPPVSPSGSPTSCGDLPSLCQTPRLGHPILLLKP